VPSGSLHSHRGPHRQSFFRLEPRDPFRIHGPPLSPQQHRESAIPKPHPTGRQRSETHPSGHLRIAMALVSHGGSSHRHEPRDSTLTDLIGRVRPAGEGPPVPRR